jgi:adenosylmethionine-8-amino-7-oxononanoate aminotransferase
MAPALLEMSSTTETSILPSKMTYVSSTYATPHFGNVDHIYEAVLLHRSLTGHLYNVISASGVCLDLRGCRKMIDACGAAAVAIVGRGAEGVLCAKTAQMMKFSCVHTHYLIHH